MKMKNELGHIIPLNLDIFEQGNQSNIMVQILRQSVHSWSIIDPTAIGAL